MDCELTRPGHLDDEAWDAIQSYRRRFETASRLNDRPGVVGAGKDLIESVARSVLESTGKTLGNKVSFTDLAREAQAALSRQPGRDTSTDPDIKAIAQSALAIATGVNKTRNKVGAGHGRSRVDDIDDEMASVVSDATMLWIRWALRRLGHLLAGDAQKLIAELHTATSLQSLSSHFSAVLLPDQPVEIQRALGVAFGQQAGGGYGIAGNVGVTPARASDDLDEWPIAYRLGLVEGFILNQEGEIGLMDHVAERLVDVLMPVPPSLARVTIEDLGAKVRDASWAAQWRGRVVDPVEVLKALDLQQQRLSAEMQPAMEVLEAGLRLAAESR